MALTRDVYQINTVDREQINFVFNRISERLDALEGVRSMTKLEGAVAYKSVTVESDYTIADDDYAIAVDTSQAVTVTLTKHFYENDRMVLIYDKNGNAGANNITISSGGWGKLDNSTSDLTISTNYGSKFLLSDGTDAKAV